MPLVKPDQSYPVVEEVNSGQCHQRAGQMAKASWAWEQVRICISVISSRGHPKKEQGNSNAPRTQWARVVNCTIEKTMGQPGKKGRKGIFHSELNRRVFYKYFLGFEGGVEKSNGRKGQEKEKICKARRWHLLESPREGGLKLPK